MKVKVHSIPFNEGLDVDFLISPMILKGHTKRADEMFSRGIACQLHLELSNSDVFLTGKAQTSIDALCYRCGGTCQYPVNLNIFLTCAQKEPRRSRIKAKPPGRKGQQRAFADQSTDQVMEESEEGLVFYDNQELDLDEIIKEQLLLSLPMRYLCKEDCKGVCMACGADLNSGVHTCKNLSN